MVFQCRCIPCKEDWPQYADMLDLGSVLTCCPQCRGRVHSVNQSYAKCLRCKKQSLWETIRQPVEEMTALYQAAMQVRINKQN